ncbi:hypothetical protein Cgig2_033126 [Carnegiea gigantea]|uniref:RNase H type-1 domain-containing protein n=1 Tax=Carnegiea gigantea TaxID=171969 RepID=A0A9Q1GY26_9CARY|nr:hypothetical protein Cgig2_033126 [Carnegiea gigantea]
MWHYNYSRGLFTIRLAYHMLVVDILDGLGSFSSHDKSLYRSIWTCNVPHASNYLDGELIGTLPTDFNISTRDPSFVMSCSICGHLEDTATHAILEHPLAIHGSIGDFYVGWGFALHDHNENILLTGVKHRRGFIGAIVEEVRACLHGLKCAYQQGYYNIIIENDCLELIHMLKNKSTNDSLVSLFVNDIVFFVTNFDFCSWFFVKKGGNKVAHDLSHQLPISLIGRMWKFDVLEDILAQALNDMFVYISNNLI